MGDGSKAISTRMFRQYEPIPLSTAIASADQLGEGAECYIVGHGKCIWDGKQFVSQTTGKPLTVGTAKAEPPKEEPPKEEPPAEETTDADGQPNPPPAEPEKKEQGKPDKKKK